MGQTDSSQRTGGQGGRRKKGLTKDHVCISMNTHNSVGIVGGEGAKGEKVRTTVIVQTIKDNKNQLM